MVVSIPISDRARKYGYIIWPKKLDDCVRKLLSDRDTVEVVLENVQLGRKRIDWKYHRISLGPTQTRRIRAVALNFHLTLLQEGRLAVTCN